MNHDIYETLIRAFVISFSVYMSSLPFIEFQIKKKIALLEPYKNECKISLYGWRSY